MVGWAAFFKIQNDEMEKARSQFRSQTTLSENKIRIKIK